MSSKLSSTTAKRLSTCIDTWHSWQAGLTTRPVAIAKLKGFSNESFLISDDQTKLVLRLNGESRRFGVDRILEKSILAKLAGESFLPSLVHWNETHDFIVTEYMPGPQVSAGRVADRLPDIGRLFGDIHQCDIDIASWLDPMDQAFSYLEQLPEADHQRLSLCSEEILSRTPNTASEEYCLCHHDLLPENIIVSAARPVALDWEYARLGNPAFDLAVFIEGCELDDSSQQGLLDAYHGPAHSRERIDHYRLLYRLIEVLWWLLKDPAEPSIAGKITSLEQRLR